MYFNTEIVSLFNGFAVGGEVIDVAYLDYNGHKNKYIVFSQSDTTNSYSGDDDISGVVDVYDFDVYSKTNYEAILKALHKLLTANGWTWQPNRDSRELYDKDTGFYHKTKCYAKPRQLTEEV